MPRTAACRRPAGRGCTARKARASGSNTRRAALCVAACRSRPRRPWGRAGRAVRSPRLVWMLMSSTLPSSVRSDRMRRQMPSSSSSLQSVASPSVMLNTTGGKLPAFSGRCVHSAARSRTGAGHRTLGSRPGPRGRSMPARAVRRAARCLPSGRRYSPCTVAGAGAMRSISDHRKELGALAQQRASPRGPHNPAPPRRSSRGCRRCGVRVRSVRRSRRLAT